MAIHRDEPDARMDEDASAVARGPDEADHLTVDEVRAVRHGRARMTVPDPWTDPDPQPGDFNADLDGIDPRRVETHPGDPDPNVTVIAAAGDDTADRRRRDNR